MTTEAQNPPSLGELTAEEKKLIACLRNEDYRAAATIVGIKMEKANWTYEHRLAFAVLARLGLAGALDADILVHPHANWIECLIDEMAETIKDSLWSLGGVRDLQKLMNDASMAGAE